jgi:hypothetical protein
MDADATRGLERAIILFKSDLRVRLAPDKLRHHLANTLKSQRQQINHHQSSGH